MTKRPERLSMNVVATDGTTLVMTALPDSGGRYLRDAAAVLSEGGSPVARFSLEDWIHPRTPWTGDFSYRIPGTSPSRRRTVDSGWMTMVRDWLEMILEDEEDKGLWTG